MICCQFIFKPGTYDDDFHELDGQIDTFAQPARAREGRRVSNLCGQHTEPWPRARPDGRVKGQVA